MKSANKADEFSPPALSDAVLKAGADTCQSPSCLQNLVKSKVEWLNDQMPENTGIRTPPISKMMCSKN